MKVRNLMYFPKNLKKLSISSVIAVSAIGWLAPIVRANHLDFTLYNESSYSIFYFYVSPARSTSWGSDVLGKSVLMSGGSTNISFPNQNSDSPCIWDVKAVFKDKTSRESRVNPCESKSVTVR